MTFIGFGVNKKEREELLEITRQMALQTFRHPVTGQPIQFLPPGAGLGTLVKVATSEYIRYFNALKDGAHLKTAVNQPPQGGQVYQQDQTQHIAQQAIARSQAIRAAGGDGET